MFFQLVYCWDIWLNELILCFLLKLESLGPICQEGGLSSVEEMDLFYIVFQVLKVLPLRTSFNAI